MSMNGFDPVAMAGMREAIMAEVPEVGYAIQVGRLRVRVAKHLGLATPSMDAALFATAISRLIDNGALIREQNATGDVLVIRTARADYDLEPLGAAVSNPAAVRPTAAAATTTIHYPKFFKAHIGSYTVQVPPHPTAAGGYGAPRGPGPTTPGGPREQTVEDFARFRKAWDGDGKK